MKILVVADLHYNLKHFDWLERVAGEYDLAVIAGDLLNIAGFVDLDAQIVVMLKYLQRISEKVSLLVSSGNHDGDIRNDAGEFVAAWLQKVRAGNISVDGQSLAVDEDLVTVFPWWDGPVTRDEMMAFIAEEKQRPHKRWLWLHHAPPGNSPVSWTGKKHIGDEHLNQSIEEHQPDFVFSGHIHNSPFCAGGSWIDRVGTAWVFNPGKSIGEFPPHIVVDLAEMKARWISYEGAEEIDLINPDARPEPLREAAR